MALDFSSEKASRRLEEYLQLYDLNKQLAIAGIQAEYPEATKEQVHQILSDRIKVVRKEKWKGHGPSDKVWPSPNIKAESSL